MSDEKQYERMFTAAVRALNRLDDHFEYKNESKQDRFFVRGVLNDFSMAIDSITLSNAIDEIVEDEMKKPSLTIVGDENG